MRPDLDWWDAPLIVLRAAGAVFAWWFVFRYARLTWRRSDEGRHLMGYTLITAIFMTLATTTALFGRYPGIDAVSYVLYGWLLYLLWRRNRLLTLAQREDRERSS